MSAGDFLMSETLAELVPKIQNIFEFLSVHREMIYDEVRTSAYRKAINDAVKEGDVVMDVGTGTGLLALLAVRAGARKVIAIEKTSIIDVARANAEKVGLAHKIDFIMSDSRSVEIPVKVDVIVSEVLGHLIVEENMLDSLIDARDRFLKPGGKLIPDAAWMFFVPVETPQLYEEEIGVWTKKVEDVDLSGAREFAINNIYIGEVNSGNYLAAPQMLLKLDLRSTNTVDMLLEGSYEVERDGVLHGMAGWFVAHLYGSTEISTAPNSQTTHWKQCFLPAKTPIPVVKGNKVTFGFSSKSVGDDVVIQWQINVSKSMHSRQAIGFSRSTLQNERSFSLRKLWLNSSATRATDSVARQIIDLGA
jgi:SAM-dependent methyltransferase